MRHLVGLVLAAAMWLAIPAQAQSANTATLSWDYNTTTQQAAIASGEVTGFALYRATGACPQPAPGPTWTKIGSVTANPLVLSYADSAGLLTGKTYCYYATATGPGGESGPSNQVAKAFPFAAPGTAPGNFTVK